jgi:hypothetical protein
VSRMPAPIRPLLAAAAVALVAAGAAGCDGGNIGGNNPGSSGQSFVGHSYQSTFYQPGHRPSAPAVSGTTISGQRLSLSAYRGDTVVLNFWGRGARHAALRHRRWGSWLGSWQPSMSGSSASTSGISLIARRHSCRLSTSATRA